MLKVSLDKKTINYKSIDGNINEITFHDLLSEGHNMDKFIRQETLFERPDHNFKHILSLLKKDSVVYDIGSYIGTFAIPMAIEGMNVYAFEGFPENYRRCVKNTAPYDITNYLCAVSDKEYSTYSKFNNCTDNELHETEIKYYRFDDFVKKNNLPEPQLVKVDIEGMESIALHAMTNLIENVRPIWSMGYHYKFYSEIEGYPGWVDVEDGGFDFQRFHELDYRIFNENGYLMPPDILNYRGGEFMFIPREKYKIK